MMESRAYSEVGSSVLRWLLSSVREQSTLTFNGLAFLWRGAPSGATARLGTPRQTLESKIWRLGIDKSRKSAPPRNSSEPLLPDSRFHFAFSKSLRSTFSFTVRDLSGDATAASVTRESCIKPMRWLLERFYGSQPIPSHTSEGDDFGAQELRPCRAPAQA